MELMVRIIERIAGLFLALVALLIFASVVLRYGFSINLPDAFDFSAYLQGIAIFWGLAVTTYRGGHISVDLFWEAAGTRGKWLIDLFACAAVTVFFALFALRLFVRLPSVVDSNQVTNDLAVPIWPFYFAASLGVLGCVVVSVLALARLFVEPPGERHG